MGEVLLKDLKVGKMFRFCENGSVFIKTDLTRNFDETRCICVRVFGDAPLGFISSWGAGEYVYPCVEELSDFIQGELVAECMKRGLRVVPEKEYKRMTKLQKHFDEMLREIEEE